ncbi:MAG TPA: signal peptidase I [Thermoanaerobaculia bacterium]|jgi:signal peptidase I|nr:signal peptidase I [Thermoanaerobaculia bacterium]
MQKSTARVILEPLAIAIALALLVRHAFFRIYSIPTESMVPTLEVGDHIVVTPYRFGDKPRPGDVIVFRAPSGSDELLVKRVIAVPGDLIDSRSGRVRIGGHALAEPYVLQSAASGAIPAQIVPGDSYFVMGDNRANSADSRSWGVVPAALVAGRARLVLWSSGDGDSAPTARAATRRTPTRLGGTIPSGRFFTVIDSQR